MSPRPTPLLAWLCLTCVPVQAVLPLTASLQAAWVGNTSRTPNPPDVKDGMRYELGLATGWHHQLSRNWQTELTAEASWQTEPDFRGLDTLQFGAAASVQRKFGLGPLAPMLQLQTGLHYANVRESDRSHTEATAGMALTKRLATTWRVTGGADWTEQSAGEPTFDLRHHRVHAALAWDVLPQWRIGLGGSRQWGEFVANAPWGTWAGALAGKKGPAVRDYYRTVPWRTTSTYGPGWVAYRVEGRANIWWLELSPALGTHTALPLRYERIDMQNKVGLRYVTEIWSLSVLHRF